jgi:hypothetical protein
MSSAAAQPTAVVPPTSSKVKLPTVTPGGCGCTVLPIDDPVAAENMIDGVRAQCFAVVIVELALAVLCTALCWVGYGFTVMLAISLYVVSILGIVHFRTLQSLRTSTCCCMPLNTIRQLHTAHIITCILAILSLVACIISAVMKSDSSTLLIASVIAAVVSLIATIFACCAFRMLCRLSVLCQQDEHFALPPTLQPPVGSNPGCLAPGAMPHPAVCPQVYYAQPQHHYHYHHAPSAPSPYGPPAQPGFQPAPGYSPASGTPYYVTAVYAPSDASYAASHQAFVTTDAPVSSPAGPQPSATTKTV